MTCARCHGFLVDDDYDEDGLTLRCVNCGEIMLKPTLTEAQKELVNG